MIVGRGLRHQCAAMQIAQAMPAGRVHPLQPKVRAEMLSMLHLLGLLHLNENVAGHVVMRAHRRKILEVQVLTAELSVVAVRALSFRLFAILSTHKTRTTAALTPGIGLQFLTVRYPHPTLPPIVFGVCIPPEAGDVCAAVVSRSLGS